MQKTTRHYFSRVIHRNKKHVNTEHISVVCSTDDVEQCLCQLSDGLPHPHLPPAGKRSLSICQWLYAKMCKHCWLTIQCSPSMLSELRISRN